MRRAITLACWAAALAIAAWAALRVFGLDRGHPLIALIAFTPHVTAAAALATVAIGVLRRKGPALVALAATLALAATIVPRVMADSDAGSSSGPALRVMSANVWKGKADPNALVALVRENRPDVLAIQELTPEFAAALDAAGMRSMLPHAAAEPAPGAGGTGLYTRLPLARLPSLPGGLNNQPAGRLEFPGVGAVEVTAVHPPPPTSEFESQWHAEQQKLPAPYEGSPSRVLVGDFNATLDHAAMRRLLDTGYRDAAAATGKGLDGTWPMHRRLGPWVTIDHVLFDEHWKPDEFRSLAPIGSDHRPLLAVIRPAETTTARR